MGGNEEGDKDSGKSGTKNRRESSVESDGWLGLENSGVARRIHCGCWRLETGLSKYR
jgi:hypothetical protein